MRFDNYLICADYDGTCASWGELLEANRKALEYYKKNGGLFTFASGRGLGFLKEKTGDTANAPVICVNGGAVCDQTDGHTLAEFVMDGGSPDVVAALTVPEDLDYIEFYGRDSVSWYWHPGLDGELRTFMDNCGKPWYKVVFFYRDADVTLRARDRARAMFGDRYIFDRSCPVLVEMQALHGGKGACLAPLRRLIGRENLTIIGVGDYENDISLIRAADIGYAVDNAIPEVKAAADRVTVSCTEGAIAAIIRDIEDGLCPARGS